MCTHCDVSFEGRGPNLFSAYLGYFLMDLDDFQLRIYRKIVATSEIQQRYKKPAGNPCHSLLPSTLLGSITPVVDLEGEYEDGKTICGTSSDKESDLGVFENPWLDLI